MQMADAEESIEDLSLVCPSNIVFFDPGDDAVLWCHLKPAISAASMEIKWWNKEDLVCHYKNGQMSYEGQVSLSLHDLHNGNVSLTLKDVRRSQGGHYNCEVICENHTMRECIFLYISTVDFSLVVPFGTVSAVPGSDVILPAHLSPETSAVSMDIRWCRGRNLIYHYNNGQEMTNNDHVSRVSLSIQELERGNLSLSLRNVQPSDSGEYTCKVFHNGCQKRGLVHLQVREIERNDDSQRVKHLCAVLRQVYENIMHQKLKLLPGTLQLIEETLNNDTSSTSTSTSVGPTSRRRKSMERIPPQMEDHSMLERPEMEDGTAHDQPFHASGPTHRCTNSREGILPLLDGECGSQNTGTGKRRDYCHCARVIRTDSAKTFNRKSYTNTKEPLSNNRDDSRKESSEVFHRTSNILPNYTITTKRKNITIKSYITNTREARKQSAN